jgi:signal transduction histidine kinase
LDDVLERILINVERVVPHDTCNIMLIEGSTARVVRARGWAERGLGEWITTVNFDFDEIARWRQLFASERPQPYAIADTHADPAWQMSAESEWIHSTAKAPIYVDGELIGILNLDSAALNFFTQQHLDRLQVFADQAAVAIRNARLYEAVQRHAAELERRVAERTAELEVANEELRVLSQMKDQFVSNVSHELRTPITSMLLQIHLSSRTATDAQRERLDVLRREARRLEDLIESLLFLSRLDQDRVTITLAAIDLENQVRDLVRDRQSLSQQHDLHLSFVPMGDCPTVTGDPRLIGQVLSILLTNAINYTPQGGQIEVKIICEEGWVGFQVSDTGPGIPDDEREQLFSRFFRGKVGRESGKSGTGLGLAIAKEIIDRHHGRIEVESEGVPGRGATFRVWLALERESR